MRGKQEQVAKTEASNNFRPERSLYLQGQVYGVAEAGGT